MRISKWLLKKTERLENKTVAISGSTGGIGNELALYLASLGASLILLDRNESKIASLSEKIKAIYPKTQISHIKVDLEKMSEVKAAAEKLLLSPPDYLILNAGAYSIPRKKCDTGYDNVFQINFISPYYLAKTLYEKIAERGGKISAVGSIAHNYSKIDSADIDFSSCSRASKVYGNAKRHLMFALFALDGGRGVVSVTHPGISFTNITAHYPKLIFAVIKYPMKIIFMPPKKAALSILYGLFESTPKKEWIGPRLFNIWGMPKKKPLRTVCDAEFAEISKRADEIYSSLI